MEFVSRFVSWLFLPLCAPVFALAAAMYLESYQQGIFQDQTIFHLQPQYKDFLIYLFTALSIVFPCLAILFFRLNGRISNLLMDNRRERIIPSIFVNGSGILLYVLLVRIDPNHVLPNAIYGLSMGSLITVAICTIITFKWKISLHAAGMGIMTGFAFAYFSTQVSYEFWIIPAIVTASGLVMSARMFLKAHTLSQLMSGYLLGTAVLFLTVFLYTK